MVVGLLLPKIRMRRITSRPKQLPRIVAKSASKDGLSEGFGGPFGSRVASLGCALWVKGRIPELIAGLVAIEENGECLWATVGLGPNPEFGS